jgi:hypothetical protein
LQALRSQEFLGRTYVPRKFPMKMLLRSAHKRMLFAGRCSS